MIFASIDSGLQSAASSAPQAIQVDFDATFLVQLVMFVALTLALKPILFDPMLKLFEERERLIDGAKAQARHLDESSAKALADYASAMSKARTQANSERERVRAEGARREQEILAGVRESTAKVIEEGKLRAHAEVARIKDALAADSPLLSRQVAARVLGREVEQ